MWRRVFLQVARRVVSGVLIFTQGGGPFALCIPVVSVAIGLGGIKVYLGVNFVWITLNRRMGFGGTFESWRGVRFPVPWIVEPLPVVVMLVYCSFGL